MDMSKEWERGDCQKKLRNGVHQEEENKVDLNLTWAEGIRGLMGEKGLMEEDWNDRSNWRKKII
jgi:hypothetical protein